jgi:hypothetical protein
MENAKKQYPTDEEVARVMADRKLNRIGAVQYLRRQSPSSLFFRSGNLRKAESQELQSLPGLTGMGRNSCSAASDRRSRYGGAVANDA